jgi:hypothetical protein
MAPSPDVYVKSALHTIGVQQCTTGYFPHTLMVRHIVKNFITNFRGLKTFIHS